MSRVTKRRLKSSSKAHRGSERIFVWKSRLQVAHHRDNVTRGELNVTVRFSSSVAVKEIWTLPLVRPAPRLMQGAAHASDCASTRLFPGPQRLNDEANVVRGGDDEVVTRTPAASNESNCHDLRPGWTRRQTSSVRPNWRLRPHWGWGGVRRRQGLHDCRSRLENRIQYHLGSARSTLRLPSRICAAEWWRRGSMQKSHWTAAAPSTPEEGFRSVFIAGTRLLEMDRRRCFRFRSDKRGR